MRPTPTNEALSAWLDGELDEAAVGELEAELARDPELRAELDQLEAVVRAVREDGPVSAPAGFDARVMARIAEEFPEEGRWAWLRRPFGVPIEGWALGLAAVAVVLLVLPVWNADSPGDEAARSLSPAAVEAPDLSGTGEPLAEGVAPEIGWKGGEKVAPTAEEPARKGAEPKRTLGTQGTEVALPQQEAGPIGKVVPVPVPVAAVPAPEPGEAVVAAPVTGTPDGPAGEAVALGPESHQLVVRSGSASVERDLLKVCGRYFWKCSAAAGAADGKMTSSRETLVVTLPQRDLALLAQELEALGHDVQRIGDENPMRGGDVSIPVVLQLVGGAADGSTIEASRPASRDVNEAR